MKLSHHKTPFYSWPLLIWGVGLSLLSCSNDSSPLDVVARSIYGDTTQAELKAYILSLPENRRRPPANQESVDWKHELLQEMLVRRHLAEEAAEADLLSTDEGRAFLESRWNPLLIEEIRMRRIAEKVHITDDDLRRYYDEHPDEFGHGPQVRVRHIFKRTTRQVSREDREKARREIQDLHRRLLEGASFTELARRHSESETAALDGLIGRLDPGALGPKVDRIVWALEEGGISEVVDTPAGFHIFRVENRLEPFKMEFAEARTRLRRRFEREETQATLTEYTDELLRDSGAVYNPDGLDDADDSVVFSLGDLAITRGEFLERILALGFEQQRSTPMGVHLEQAATGELHRWEADRVELAQEPEMLAQREKLEQTASVELAFRGRRRAHLEKLDDSVLRSYYEENEKRFRSPQQLKLRLIVRHFEAEGQEWFALYEELDRLAKAIRSGELDFANQAIRFSEDISAFKGGDTGWIRPGAVGEWAGPRASKATLSLKLNEVSDPILIESYDDNRLVYKRNGYMLIRVQDLRPAATPPFEEVRNRVAEYYVTQGSEQLKEKIQLEVLEEIDAVLLRDHL